MGIQINENSIDFLETSASISCISAKFAITFCNSASSEDNAYDKKKDENYQTPPLLKIFAMKAQESCVVEEIP